MKKLLVLLFSIFLLLGMSCPAGALLFDRGGGLIYDDFLDITWLQNANYGAGSVYDDNIGGGTTTDGKMTWDNAVAWAGGLEYYDIVRGVTYDNWRLPDAHNRDGSGPDTGYNVTGSELGHMFYNNLGGTAGSFPGATFTDGNGDSVSFQNMQPPTCPTCWLSDFWSGTEDAADTDYAWAFTADIGYQDHALKGPSITTSPRLGCS